MSAAVAGAYEALGLDEVEPGIIEDNSTNRRRLMALGKQDESGWWSWERVLTEDGELTGLIRPLSPDQVTVRRTEVAKWRRPILEIPDNPWSDYVHPDDYPLDVDLPYWVELRLRRWREDEAAGVPEAERRRFPTRCSQLRLDNTRCWLWVNKPDETSKCSKHHGVTKEAVERNPAYARMRLLESSVDAVDNLIYLATYAEGEAVRLKANTEILDRSGVRGGTEIDINAQVTQVDPGKQLHDRLATLAARHTAIVEEDEDAPLALPPAEEPVDAELVEDEEEQEPA